MKQQKRLFAVLTMCIFLAVTACFTVFAADDIVFTFESEDTMKGWSNAYVKYNFDPGQFNAYTVQISENKSDPMLISPALDIKAEDYRYVVVNTKYTLDSDWSRNARIFFLVPDGNWSHDNSVAGPYYEELAKHEFVDLVFDMSTNDAWKGDIKQIRYDPFDCPGSFQIKSITLTNTAPEIKEEPKEEAKPETQAPEDTAKQTGVFLKPRSYSGNFTDVPTSEWYAAEVAAAFELGLVNGKSDTMFDPAGGMTVAEAITMAANTRNAYGSADYDFSAADGEEWFAPYVKYATDNGIIKADTFADYNKAITRGEMALIFAGVLPNEEYAAINSVTAIPDVARTSPYFASILKLYNAGIVMGNDGYGTFHPDNGIIRAEAAAIINRVALKENRLSKNLINTAAPGGDAIVMSSEAKFLMDDEKFSHTHMGGVAGNWDIFKTYETSSKETRPSSTLTDTSETHEAYFTRKFFEVKDGVLDFEFGAKISSFNGAFLRFIDANQKPVVEVLLDMGKYTVLAPDGSYTDTAFTYTSNSVHFDFHINLDNGTFDLGIDGAYAGTYPLASDRAICEFRYGVTKEGYMTIGGDYAVLTHNYLLLERFVNAPDHILPYHVGLISDGGKVEKVMINTNNANGGSVKLASQANGKTGIYGNFEKASGNVVFETYILLPEVTDGAKIAITSGGSDVFYLTTADGNFVAPNGETVKYVTKNLWHILRFEADTATGKALVKINGKNVGTYDFVSNPGVIDGYQITYVPNTDANMFVDDLTAFIKLPYPDDYVPEPVIPNGDDYFVGLNVCSLWREGVHYGWEEITGYPEITPVLGYYDEGTPEVSDWEIKMMTEHGIDYQIFCWYPVGNITAPIQHTAMNEALIDGYFNAKYSDKMQFAIMWENTTVNNMKFEDFKNYTVPYWIEYFFKDERYVKLDNKPMLTVWQANNKFSDASFKEAMDYIREACRAAGFDGCEIFQYTSETNPSYESTLNALGMDGVIGYHWGTNGANAETQAKNLTSYSALSYSIPTISVGFDYVGWGFSEQRNGLLDPKDYPTMANIVKDALAKRVATGAKYANMVNISTWNEYGEGTYVMPTERFGFGYLDAIRQAFTKDDTAHSDLTLTASQRQRINYLFGQDRQILRPQLLDVKQEENTEDPYAGAEVVRKITFEDMTIDDIQIFNGTAELIDGILHLVPNGKDPAAFTKADYEPVPTEEANAVRIRARVTGSATHLMNLFYRVDDGGNFAADKLASAPHVIGEWNDYVFDFRKDKNWKGNIVNLRIDPAEYQCDLAEIESIEFLKLPELVEETPFTVDINGYEVAMYQPVIRTEDGLLFALYPETGILAGLKSIYTWDKNEKLLTITNGDHTVSFVIGKDTATVDGKEIKLYAATYMDDGLPVLPLDILATSLGYFPVLHEDGNGVSIMLCSAEDYEIIKERKPGEYEFNLDDDLEGWVAQQSTVSVKGGTIIANATGGDPALYSPALSIEAKKYPTVVIGMKWKCDEAKRTEVDSCVYFTTANGGLSESRNVYKKIPVSSDDKVVELRFDMGSHLQWQGNITSIRFDPYNAVGTYEIDYIRFEIDPEAEALAKKEEELKNALSDTATNGDAEDVNFNPMTSPTAVVTIVPREDDKGHCYNVKANAGKVWSYVQQKIKYTPGTTYTVSFDARMVGANDGNTTPGIETDIYVNLMYDGGSGRDHPAFAGKLVMEDGYKWTHYQATITVGDDCNNLNDELGIFTNPIENTGVDYQIDNLTIIAE